jgi:hypothetical protein
MTSKRRYDLIFSEPSNPYRAGVASLYTHEFYRAAADRLAPGGIFSQFVQAYSVDADTIGRIAATLAAVFPNVEVWQPMPADLLFVCSMGPLDYSVPNLEARVATEPFRSALLDAWGLEGLEGLLSGFFATDAFARHALQKWGRGGLNTDDRSPVEFGFIRSLSRNGLSLSAFRRDTRARGAHRPALSGGGVDWGGVEASKWLSHLVWQPPGFVEESSTELEEFYKWYAAGNFKSLLGAWEAGRWKPAAALEKLMLADVLTSFGDGRAVALLPVVAAVWPNSAAALEANLFLRTGNPGRALASLERAVTGFREVPWDPLPVMNRSLNIGNEIAEADPALALRLFELFAQPFSVRILDGERIYLLTTLSALLDCRHAELALAEYEPYIPMVETLLRYRAHCYGQTGNPLAARARSELDAFLKDAGSADPGARGPARAAAERPN